MAIEKSFKVSKKGLVRSVVLGLILSIAFVAGNYGFTNLKLSQGESSAVTECKVSYERLVADGYIDPTVVTKNDQQVNCQTIGVRVDNLLDEYSNGTFNSPVYITGYNKTICDDTSFGCVFSYTLLNDRIPPIMNIAYTADYGTGLEETVAHEYTHTLMNKAEHEWLTKNGASIYNTNTGTTITQVNPVEAAADCGIEYFTGKPLDESTGTYMTSCTPEQLEISYKIITDTLV